MTSVSLYIFSEFVFFFCQRLTHDGDTPVADAAKLYWAFVRTMQSGIPGVILTVLIYILLFIISSLILYLYCLR